MLWELFGVGHLEYSVATAMRWALRGAMVPRDRTGCTAIGSVASRKRRADRQTGRQADRQTGRQADRQTGRQADNLTGREHQTLGLLARGMNTHEVAAELVSGEATVKAHVRRLLTKPGVHDRVQAGVPAHETGVAEPGAG